MGTRHKGLSNIAHSELNETKHVSQQMPRYFIELENKLMYEMGFLYVNEIKIFHILSTKKQCIPPVIQLGVGTWNVHNNSIFCCCHIFRRRVKTYSILSA